MICDVLHRRDLYALSKPPTRERRSRTNVHHIYAISRFPHLRHAQWNRVRCDPVAHELLHMVFGNRTPEESTALVRRYFRLVEGRMGEQAIQHLARKYWPCLQQHSSDPTSLWIGKSQWRDLLRGNTEKEYLIAVFGKSLPWKIVRWIVRLDELVGRRSESEMIKHLARTFWNGMQLDCARKPAKKRIKPRKYHRFHRPCRVFARA
ncbi:MAG: hypothetical protein Q7S57_02245 [bacterium]|nr:hypothetical protein [bacterium]